MKLFEALFPDRAEQDTVLPFYRDAVDGLEVGHGPRSLSLKARKGECMKFSLRTILTAAFILVSVIPLGLWAAWASTTALEREEKSVETRHLLLARNISGALSRYASDAVSVFEMAIATPISFGGRADLQALLGSMSFRILCIVDVSSQQISSFVAVGDNAVTIPSLDRLIEKAERKPGTTIFSPVIRNSRGKPAIYLLHSDGKGTVAIGELSTDYIRHFQNAVNFGLKGHGAVVDNTGSVIGHPRADWVDEIKNLSTVEPVKRMIAGETGVSTFYSPSENEDMIAGFTVVPETGWGVMIPQPFSELEASAREVRKTAFWVVGAGAAIAALLGWFLSGLVTGPLSKIVGAARLLAGGAYSARVEGLERRAIPFEIQHLSNDFNKMAEELEIMHVRDQRTLRAAEEAVEAKSDFVARISHELRTPLNAVIGFSGMIRSEANGRIEQSEYKEYANLIHDAGEQLLSTINDILSFARADNKSGALQEEEIDLAETIDFIVGQHCGNAIESNVALTAEIQPDLPNIRADELKLRQILTHIISNGVRFTPEGGAVVVETDYVPDEGIRISVKDTGIGMSEDQLPVALQPFGQLENRLTRRFNGTGLGLPLAKMLVDLHGGTFTVESTVGKGTTVTITLPADRVVPKIEHPRLAV